MTLKEYIEKLPHGGQKALADELGTSESYLSTLKSGARKPGRSMAEAIEEATGGKVSAASAMGFEKA